MTVWSLDSRETHASKIMLRKEGMGLLNDLAQLQETYRGLVQEAMKDHPAPGGLDEDNIISVCCVFREMSADFGAEAEPSANDVITAIDFLDHLDTLGKEIRPKWTPQVEVVQMRKWPGQPNSE